MDYSQCGEQAAIRAAVGETVGHFLDIGAWNPKTFSNTRALFERGWSGVMVEPSPEPFLSLLKEYGNEPRVSLICAAVGFDQKLIRMHATADAVSTSDETVRQTWQKDGGYYGSFHCAQIKLEDITEQCGGEFDFVNIDAEGTSVSLFARLLFIGYRPRCICVEYDNRLSDVKQYAHNAGYRAVLENGTNVVLSR